MCRVRPMAPSALAAAPTVCAPPLCVLLHAAMRAVRAMQCRYEDQQKIVDMTTSSTNSFLDAWSTLVEATRSGNTKHVSKLCHLYPSISFKVMVIGVLLAYLGTADNCRQPTYILYGKVY